VNEDARPAPRHRGGPGDAVAEIRRGIEETTGLPTSPAEPGWIAVACESPRMAAWLCATIILENVDARARGETLLVPASAGYRLEDEVKSVITVVAKTHHYWLAHARVQRGGDACSQSSFR
jgi:sirohydrochlorin cobaltochelatase